MLHVTNGDCALEVLRAAGMPGELLPWRDVLHEGPVDASLPLDGLSALRSRFVAQAGWASLDEAERQFRARDERLRRSGGDDEVILWFEHDLYDQLQLIQLLDWFRSHPHPRLSLICEAEYLGEMAPARAAELFGKRRRVTQSQLAAGSEAWRAFGSPDVPEFERTSRKKDLAALAFLPAALRRQLEEFPWTGDALSRTERQVLEALDAGAASFDTIFRETQKREEPRFLGDSVLRWHLERMEKEGRLRRIGEAWAIADRHARRRLPRWLGGARVDERCPWRWDPARARLVR